MRLLLFIAFVSSLLVGCQSRHDVASSEIRREDNVAVSEGRSDGIYDFTTNRLATCEVHAIAMTPQVVELEFGMKALTETYMARRRLFPHADEPYDTGYCIPLVEKRGRVFVCSGCTEARATWIRNHKTQPR